MQVYPLFYAWVPKYVRYFVLTLFAFVMLGANGVYLGITTDMYSDLGEYAEPYTMALNALYIGMGAGLIFYVRLGLRFSNKTLVLTGLSLMLLMNVVCATTSSPALTIAAVLVLGFSKILVVGEIFVALLQVWSKNLNSARVYPFFYFLALAGIYFLTWFTAYVTNLYSWRYAYFVIFILIATCIILGIIFIENHPLKKKIPLYQLDIPGVLLFVILLMLINYVAVYGKVENWFQSNTISAALFAAVITTLLFVRREMTLKRPFFNLALFRLPNFSIGLLLLLLLGALSPGTFQSSFSASVLHFESIRNAEIYLYLIPGVVAGSVLSFFWYKKNWDGHLLMIIGFAAFVWYHIMMYTLFVNDVSITAFWVPSFFKGFATAVLYIAIALYATANIQLPGTLKAVGMIVMVRSFLGSGVFSGIYSYFLYAERNRHLSRLASEIDANEPMLLQHANFAGYHKYILQQANLAALKELSGNIIIFGLSIVILLIVVLAYRKIKKWIFAIS